MTLLSRQMEPTVPRVPMTIDLHLCNTQPGNLLICPSLLLLCALLHVLDWFLQSRETVCVYAYLWTQQDHFSHAEAKPSHFGLWYICRENDDLMVFQMLCNRRITHVREEEGEEEEEERGSLS